MKIKKLASLLLCGIMAGVIFAGCGSQESGNKPVNKETKVGMLTNLNISEQQHAALLKQAAQRGNVTSLETPVITYYDNLNTMQMGLESGSIDAMSTYRSIADYLMAKNPKFVLTGFEKMKLADSFCCALREEDKGLLEEMNKAISSMQQDGTLDSLVKEYITDVKDGKEPPAVPLTKIEGADTIKVAVTGDLPPIDLVLANGTPAGFNTAVLAELSKRLGKNIELVQVSSGARASILASSNADVVFWAVVPADDFAIRPNDFDLPKGIVTTIPYYKDDIVHVTLKK